jgi:hypothetical protein
MPYQTLKKPVSVLILATHIYLFIGQDLEKNSEDFLSAKLPIEIN